MTRRHMGIERARFQVTWKLYGVAHRTEHHFVMDKHRFLWTAPSTWPLQHDTLPGATQRWTSSNGWHNGWQAKPSGNHAMWNFGWLEIMSGRMP